MMIRKTMALLGIVVFLGMAPAACDTQEGAFEEGGENVDRAIDRTGDSMDRAGDRADDAVEDAGDRVEDATN